MELRISMRIYYLFPNCWVDKTILTLVAGGRFELPTSGLWIQRSHQLSYPAIPVIPTDYAHSVFFNIPFVRKFVRNLTINFSFQSNIDLFHCPLSFSSIPFSLVLASPILLKKTNSIKPKPSFSVIAPH